jgi:hypothetical protein
LTFRAGSTGTYYVEVSTSSGTSGDYLLSIARNCRVSPAVDLAVTQVDSPDPVSGANVTYAVSVANLTGSAAKAHFSGMICPPGQPWSPPRHPRAAPDRDPFSASSAASRRAHGERLDHRRRSHLQPYHSIASSQVSSYALDTVPGNDSSSQSTTVGSPDADGDGVPDAVDCAPADSSVWAIPGEASGPDLSKPR